MFARMMLACIRNCSSVDILEQIGLCAFLGRLGLGRAVVTRGHGMEAGISVLPLVYAGPSTPAVRPPLPRQQLAAMPPTRLPLVPSVTLPLFKRSGQSLGSRFFFEQRYWVYALQCDSAQFIKYERQNGIRAEVIERFRLEAHDFCRPTNTDSVSSVLPIVLSTRGLIGWLITRAVMSGFGRGRKYIMSWYLSLQNVQKCISDAGQFLADKGMRFPVIQCGDAAIGLTTSGQADVVALCSSQWRTLPTEWDMIRAKVPWSGLAPFSWNIGLVSFLHFLDLRVRASNGQIAVGHWMLRLQDSLLNLAAWFVEVACEADLASQPELAQRPTELWGASGARRSPHQVQWKLSILEQIYAFGSRETICRSLGRGKGTAAQLAACFTRLYMNNVAAEFSLTQSVAVHVDGSTHDGHDVQIGAAVLPRFAGEEKNRACVLPPAALLPQLLTLWTSARSNSVTDYFWKFGRPYFPYPDSR